VQGVKFAIGSARVLYESEQIECRGRVVIEKEDDSAPRYAATVGTNRAG